ncbi:MAG TPA: hypothetical protein VGC67_14570 [Cellulomonas sp.]
MTGPQRATDAFPVGPASVPNRDEVGEGRFSLAVDAFVWCVRLTVQLAVAALPIVLLALLLRPDESLAWLVVLAALPVGPALAAGLFAVRARYREPHLAVERAFWRGYRRTWRDVVPLWMVATLVLGAIALVATGGGTAGIPALYRGVLLGLGVLVALGTLHALALAAFFRFPVLDAAQLGAYFLVRRWRVSLALLVLVVAAFGVAAVLSDVALVVLSGLWVWLCYRCVAPVPHDAYDRYVGDVPPDPSPV